MFLLETINIKSQNTGFQSLLKSGAVVSFSVGRRIEPGVFSINLLGKTITVRSSENLVQGSVLKARVKWTKNRLNLTVIGNKKDSQTVFFERSGIVPGKELKLIADSLINSGLPLLPEYFSRLQPVVKRYKNIDNRLARILILLMDKGIPLTDQNVSEILSLTGGRGRQQSSDWNNNKDRSEKTMDKDDIKKDLKQKINKIDFGMDLLKYFNHRIAGHDNWLIIPLDFSFSRKGHGLLKLRLDDKFTISNLVLTLDDGFEWEFNLVRSGTGRKISVRSTSKYPWSGSPAFLELKEKLYKKDIFFDDINRETVWTDGFTQPAAEGLESVDFTV